jgi:ABC-type multidrug transport system ATPase subunit
MKEKIEIVEKVMEDLRITNIADRKVGDSYTRGISGGEKRRVSIGTELVVSPHVLFLDEPTSGLDAYNAYTVIKTLCDLAKKGRTIGILNFLKKVFSIHQPRSNIFSQFDEIILLNHGEIIYGGSSEKAEEYFIQKGKIYNHKKKE